MRTIRILSIALLIVLSSFYISVGADKKEVKQKIICIDAGHQQKGNYEKEPIGPGSKTMKAKVSSGTTGVSTKKPEYVLTLELSKLLQKKLEERGYKVIMIRDKHDVNISNKERADIANKANADLFLRIHADGVHDSKVNGISTIYPSEKNPYVAHLSKKSKKISTLLASEMAHFTKAKNRGAFARDDMSGLNWSKVPVSIVEAGFMSNPAEDKLLSDPQYQEKLVQGMVNAIELYFQQVK
ncbi:MAG: N-acetylmuramoyl-L-alanine amidase [Peptostreptococcaceae bacterium]|nr:N-acetylmuramoyl-L-alanine amidase [Peptostreptococcaceae bacterium]